nr:hypothetical protein Iba_chr06fCG0730 [Ipomoea batatas]
MQAGDVVQSTTPTKKQPPLHSAMDIPNTMALRQLETVWNSGRPFIDHADAFPHVNNSTVMTTPRRDRLREPEVRNGVESRGGRARETIAEGIEVRGRRVLPVMLFTLPLSLLPFTGIALSASTLFQFGINQPAG